MALRCSKFLPYVVLMLICGYVMVELAMCGMAISMDIHSRANKKPKAALLMICDGTEWITVTETVRDIEDRFNNKYHYDWVVLSEKPFEDDFKRAMSSLVSGKVKYGIIPQDHLALPSHIDEKAFNSTRNQRLNKGQLTYDLKSLLKMRYHAGYFYRHPALTEYRYYWKISRGDFGCDVNFDVFKYMQDNGKNYAFSSSVSEVEQSDTLRNTAQEFFNTNSHYLPIANFEEFVFNPRQMFYRFLFPVHHEIASLDLWRGEAYTKYFEYLDQTGGIFDHYWQDSAIRSIGMSMFLNPSEACFIDEVGDLCLVDEQARTLNRCVCRPPSDDSDYRWRGVKSTRNKILSLIDTHRP